MHRVQADQKVDQVKIMSLLVYQEMYNSDDGEVEQENLVPNKLIGVKLPPSLQSWYLEL